MEKPCWINCPLLRLVGDDRHLLCLMDERVLMSDLSDSQIAHFAYLIGENAKEIVRGAQCPHAIEAILVKACLLSRSN